MGQADELFRTVASLVPSELAAFDAVVRHGGFRAAARATGASPSALSHAVAGLERRLATQLLLRSSRSVSLTDAGQRFMTALRPAITQIGEAIEQLHGKDAEPSGIIRINVSTIAMEQLTDSVLTPFMNAKPRISVEIGGDGAFVDISESSFDCGIRLLGDVPQDMVAIPVGSATQQHVVVAAPSYLKTAPPISAPADLAAHQCVQLRLSPGSVYRWEFVREGKDFTMRTEGRLVVDSPRLALQAAKGGLGLAYVTRWLAADALNSGELNQVLENWTPPYPGLAVYYHRNRQMGSAMRAFISHLRLLRGASG